MRRSSKSQPATSCTICGIRRVSRRTSTKWRIGRVRSGAVALGERQRPPRSLYTPSSMRVFVILPAAGLGTRMAPGAAPKQFLELRGTPILIHTLRAFTELPSVAGVYIAVRKPEIPRLKTLLDAHGLNGAA